MKNGVQIDCIDPQIKQVIESLLDALQVPSLEAPSGWSGSPAGEIGWVILRVSVGKTVRENLVEYCVLDPLWNGHIVLLWRSLGI